MECPYCGLELIFEDYYGRGLSEHAFEKLGDIYRCNNEDCESYREYFYTDSNDELHEGYPC
jgi:hypothetical protein